MLKSPSADNDTLSAVKTRTRCRYTAAQRTLPHAGGIDFCRPGITMGKTTKGAMPEAGQENRRQRVSYSQEAANPESAQESASEAATVVQTVTHQAADLSALPFARVAVFCFGICAFACYHAEDWSKFEFLA